MSNTVDTVKWKFENVYPYDLLATFWKTHNIRKTVRQQREKVKNFVFHAEKIDTTDTREIYVFVIGESARYDNFSINGYEKDTSPLLEKTNNLISYSDYYSGANATMNSVPLMLTRSTPQTFEISQEEKTFVDAFKEAGFKTYWLGNQCGGSEYIRRISKDADGEYFNSGGENSILYDETLWPYFRKILNKNENKVLIVLHTLGSHFRYELRHPPRFKVFTPSYEGALDRSELIPKNRQKLMNTYDNSILYTDYFLANTINMIDSLKAISSLIYVSDHGENFFDTDENLFIHANLRYSKYDVHVPLFVWCSDQYIKNWGEKYEMMKQNKDKKISQANMFYSVLDIANITFPGQRLDKSFASGSLVEDSVRYIYKIDNTVEKLNF
ncbi:MAG: phosphoethanolamine transferase [Candidatus Azobacteroides sp.]|nr:phosphoethanolamine transferase [Candidatus Azobacteroides sp.]